MLITLLSGGYYLSTYTFTEVNGFSKTTYYKVGKAEFELRAMFFLLHLEDFNLS